MEKNWIIRKVSEHELAKLAYTGFPEILLRILLNRGIADERSIERFFEPRARFLFSPYMINGIAKAVDRIYRAIENEESIRVYGDRDVDGITSTVLLTETLQTLSSRVDYTVPVIEDGYGLNPDYIDAAANDGISLIITVDCGISNIEEVEYAASKGIELVITDHHEPPENLPKAYAIVDPKLHDSNCPQKDIAGVGVAFKLAIALEMARSPRLAKPLLIFDITGSELDIVTFSPRNGFGYINSVDDNILKKSVPVFYSFKDYKSICEIVPEIARNNPSAEYKPVFVDKILAGCIKDATLKSKRDYLASMNIEGLGQALSLGLMYLKCIESKMESMNTLWRRSLDILAIGTIADMVPLKGENRTYAQMGLKFAARTSRQGLSSLFGMLGWKSKNLSERDISFGIAPVLNSSGRLKTAELAIQLLMTSSKKKADDLAAQLLELNNERKRLGEDCYIRAKDYLVQQNDLENDRILLVAPQMSNQGVTGIVATRLMLDYSRPVIVVLEDQGKLMGSARSFKDINIIDALNYCSDLLEKFGGHVGAAGLTLEPENLDKFRVKLREYALSCISLSQLEPEWLIDSVIDLDSVTEQFLDDILRFAPFGIENPAPLFVAQSAFFQEIRKVGDTKNHLRFKSRCSNGRLLFGIGFNLGHIMVPDFIRDATCDLVFHVEANEYNNVRTVQLMIVDCRIRGFK